jgi:hypothetical protein
VPPDDSTRQVRRARGSNRGGTCAHPPKTAPKIGTEIETQIETEIGTEILTKIETKIRTEILAKLATKLTTGIGAPRLPARHARRRRRPGIGTV